MIPIGEHAHTPLVTVGQCFDNLLVDALAGSGLVLGRGRLFQVLQAQFFLQIIVAQPLAPQPPGFVHVLGIRSVFAACANPLVGVELELLMRQKVLHVTHPLFQALHKP